MYSSHAICEISKKFSQDFPYFHSLYGSIKWEWQLSQTIWQAFDSLGKHRLGFSFGEVKVFLPLHLFYLISSVLTLMVSVQLCLGMLLYLLVVVLGAQLE